MIMSQQERGERERLVVGSLYNEAQSMAETQYPLVERGPGLQINHRLKVNGFDGLQDLMEPHWSRPDVANSNPDLNVFRKRSLLHDVNTCVLIAC